jgi:hemin uptake protein HemP
MDDRERPDRPTVARGDPTPPRISTRQLFAGGHTEIRIDHEGIEYRLRITKQNRLILYR